MELSVGYVVFHVKMIFLIRARSPRVIAGIMNDMSDLYDVNDMIYAKSTK
jgi:hypothetical protein